MTHFALRLSTKFLLELLNYSPSLFEPDLSSISFEISNDGDGVCMYDDVCYDVSVCDAHAMEHRRVLGIEHRLSDLPHMWQTSLPTILFFQCFFVWNPLPYKY